MVVAGFLRVGGGRVMMSARGQFHSGGGPPSGGRVAEGTGADRRGIWECAVPGERAALSPPPPEEGSAAEVPHTACMCRG
jgi:hypothetical protein